VCTVDGQTYERAAIETWLEQHATSPVTGAPLASKALVPNLALRDAIRRMSPAKRLQEDPKARHGTPHWPAGARLEQQPKASAGAPSEAAPSSSSSGRRARGQGVAYVNVGCGLRIVWSPYSAAVPN